MAGWLEWTGTSRLDGITPLVLIATLDSKNAKTGDMIQTWILRADMIPSEGASKGKGDAPICGTCPLRGSETSPRRCYVNTAFAPNGIWKAWQRGAYGDGPPPGTAGSGQALRLGAYGDPAAVPFTVWEGLLAMVGPKKFTGYTHQWRTCDAKFAQICMASVETWEEAEAAHARGYRTFRTGSAIMKGEEILCPASLEGGYKVTCTQCGLCAGSTRPAKSIMIHPHGAAKGRF